MKNKWKDEVIRQLDICGIYQTAHDENPKKALHDLVCYNMEVAVFFEKEKSFPRKLRNFFYAVTNKLPPF